MKKLFIVFLLTFNVLCITQINAELFDGSIHYYINSGQDLTASTKVIILYFCATNNRIWTKEMTKGEISDNLRKDGNYISELKNKWNGGSGSYCSGKYSSSFSTSSYDVWADETHNTISSWDEWGPIYKKDGYLLRAFKKDKSVYIKWSEDLDGNIVKEKKYYIEVSIEDLMPKAVNRDFLYE